MLSWYLKTSTINIFFNSLEIKNSYLKLNHKWKASPKASSKALQPLTQKINFVLVKKLTTSLLNWIISKPKLIISNKLPAKSATLFRNLQWKNAFMWIWFRKIREEKWCFVVKLFFRVQAVLVFNLDFFFLSLRPPKWKHQQKIFPHN